MKKSKVTTEDLAKEIRKGFKRVDEKFDKVDQKFDKVDQKFDKVNQKFDKADQKFDKVDQKFDNFAAMVQRGFEDMRGEVHKGFTEVKDWQRFTDGRLGVIEMDLMDIKKKLENVIDRREFEILKERVGRLENFMTNKKR